MAVTTENFLKHSTKNNVFLIGGTGFIGKVVLERLLARKDVECVFLLVRPKGGKTPSERLLHMRKLPCFSNVQEAFIQGRVQGVPGDTSKPGLGLDPENRKKLTEVVTQIISLAASIEFDLPMLTAAKCNIGAALTILELAKECEALTCFTHCSTAYVMSPTTDSTPIFEGHVPTFTTNGLARELYNHILDGGVSEEEEEKSMLQEYGYPNTYTYTKALAETLLNERKDNVPLVIVRPSIVTACARYPLPGWIDSRAALAAFLALYGIGFLHTIPAKGDAKLDIVPCDYVASRLIYGALDKDLDRTHAPVINATSGIRNSMTLTQMADTTTSFFAPKDRQTNRRPFPRVMAEDRDPRLVASFRQDKRDALILYYIAKLFCQAKQATTLGRLVNGLNKIETVFSFFTHNTFRFESKWTVEDEIKDFQVCKYMHVVHCGVHHYLLGGEEGVEWVFLVEPGAPTERSSMVVHGRPHPNVSRQGRKSIPVNFRPVQFKTKTGHRRYSSAHRSTLVVFGDNDNDINSVLASLFGLDDSPF